MRLEIAKGLVIQSIIKYFEYPDFLKTRNWLQSKSFQKKIIPQSIFIIKELILINNSTNLNQEKTSQLKPKTMFFSKQKTTKTKKQLLKTISCMI